MAPIVTVQVKTISTEIIKPSSPTPSHLKSFTLSLVDQIHPPYHSIILLFYPKTKATLSTAVDVSILKSSLSETLSKYYPFAGRCMDDFTVSCNDQGITFTETRVDYVLSDFLASPNKVDHLYKLTPPKNIRDEKVLPQRYPLAFQVNVFSCGGVVLGCFFLHKLVLDGTSQVSFLKYWAAIAANSRRNRDSIIVPPTPDFDAVAIAFPPRATVGSWVFENNSHEDKASDKEERLIAKNFVFSKQAISQLREMAASTEVPKPTRVEALAGFVWEHCVAAASSARTPLATSDHNPSIMSVVVNMRPRIKPPLSTSVVGNLVTSASAHAKEGRMRLPELVKEIHTAVSNISDTIESYQGGKNIEALVADVGPVVHYIPGLYGVSSWTQFGLDEIDFGFGKPKWASPTNGILAPTSRNFIYFVVDTNGDGIEVWLYLVEKEMKNLESNKKFLAFACPN
ncbi:limonoid 21-O-acetyltransferse-like [Silene latifolia]|uniref:limonoid 21-O-acetyltransferse-like n=1 Tax=Silene latifolia TaxID=37657 RepID=UPI003D777E70